MRFEAAGLVLVPLGPEHNDEDFDAWTSSVDHIKSSPGFAGRDWPSHEAMPREQNRAEVLDHRHDFEGRRGFTYTMLDPSHDDRVVGCLYIYPPARPGYEAFVRSWVTATHAHLDGPVAAAIHDWLGDAWPFAYVDYRGRWETAMSTLAVDFGGTKVAAGLVDAAGHLRSRRQEPTARELDAEGLYQRVRGLAEAARVDADSTPAVVGIGCGGPAREHSRFVSPLNVPTWVDFPLAERLAEDLGLPTFIDNDAKALALAEGWLGAARGVDNYIGMVVSTGIGGGIVLEGRLLDGADGNAGHIGHVFVDPDGRPDGAGARGHLEGQASGTGIAALTGAPAEDADVAVRRRTGQLVGLAVASVANLLDLQLAVVSGSVALGYGDDFFDAAQATIDDHALLLHSKGTRIVPGALGADGPLIGAAAVAFSALGHPVLKSS